MSDLAKRIDATANAELLIQQWRRVPRMQALMEALLEVVDVHLVKPLADMERMTMIGTAEGVWLDYIGERLGVARPATDLGNFSFFGFQGSGGVGFDQGLLATVTESLSPRVSVGDGYYRVVLRMRSAALLANGSVPGLERVVQKDFPEASYQDGGDMTATLHVTDTRTQLLAILSAIDAWPKPSGVALTVDTS